ncbi:TetR family transcriptional regulator [Amycolatopsis sp. RM579]|uniref:TetR family transcriptional regulator n=2 Tax=Amycolatopsis pithecellobii TaxID=664692 RepID=A0A6N7Z5X0_9PSEU|nr:TetR family transcriptional regulator [Amycolatopsis pithecellobii]
MPSIEALAREAGLGVGTVYRNYPTREALVDAVFRAEREELCARVKPLLDEHEPVVALRRWMDFYAGFVAVKHGMAKTRATAIPVGTVPSGDAKAALTAAVGSLITAGVHAGTLRADVRVEDVVATLAGIFLTAEDRTQAGRQLDLLVDGLRTAPPKSPS